MKKRYLLLIILSFSLAANGQNYEWAKFLGRSSGSESARDIAVDESGNVYTVGRFIANAGQSVDFDPGPGTFTFNRSGNYISKLNSNGDLVWVRNLPNADSQGFTISTSLITNISIDSVGDLVILGVCDPNADLDAGPGIFTLPEVGISVSTFVAKYSASGNFIWAKAFPGNIFNTLSSGLTIDNENNIVLGITFRGQIDADPGPDTLLFDAGQGYNVIILKLTSTGNLIWVKYILGELFLYEITTDMDGQIYSSGTFNSAVFDGLSSSPSTVSAGLYDGFILKMDGNGDLVWVKTMGGLSYDYATSLKTDTIGNVYCTGYFTGSAWFNNATDSLFLNSTLAGGGGFTAKLDSSGNCIWAKSFGGNTDSLSFGTGSKIEVDSIGNTYTLASVSGNVVFNSGFENVIENFIGIEALAIIKHDNNGNLIRVRKADGNINIRGSGLALDDDSNLYFNGLFNVANNGGGAVRTGAIDMDPSIDTAALVGFGSGQDCIFVAKWSQCTSGISTNAIDACTNYIWNNDTILNSGTYTKNLTNADGCDSTAVLNLNILSPVTASQSIQLCFGDSLVINNQIYTQTGVYQNILTASNGCDSIVNTTLFIDTVQVQITNVGQTLSAINFAQNAVFQWLDCNTNFTEIPNQTDSVFYVINDGNYALLISQNGCVDTSDCYNVSTVNLIELTNKLIEVYPNPAIESFSISIPDALNLVSLSIIDTKGIIIKELSVKHLNVVIDDLAAGIYFVRYQTKSNINCYKIIKL